MKRIVITFGVISGAVSSAMMFLTLPLISRGTINFKNGEVIGYTSIFLSFVIVFFGIRSYRENNGGTISFGRAFGVGILITLISCLFYVASWEIIYFKVMPDFTEKFANAAIASLREKGASDAAIDAKKREMAQLKAIYDNPLTNAAVTFLEPFPVGLIVTLVSAGILRRREGALMTTVAS
ncbi:MAG TPA: DUF4199 domain-containing protein [Thermoanaerobaculia bacterium]|nr:DUF4199 domain-containing protein [Thermoanaerobaculia bacterium]